MSKARYTPGGDAKIIAEVARRKFGGFTGMFERHGWPEGGQDMMPKVQTRVVESYGSVRDFEARYASEPNQMTGSQVHAALDEKRAALRDLCRKFSVARLDVFGSAARGADFDAGVSDVDFLVTFEPPGDSLARFLDFHDALEALLGRPVDLIDRKDIETSRNYIRRRLILDGAEPVYAA